MKNSKKTSSTVDTQFQKKTSLFESLISNESVQAKEAEIHKYTTRVGLVLKVLSNRDLTALQLSFQDDLTKIVKKYCGMIDNELSPASKD